MSASLKQKAVSGMIWNAVERFGTAFFLFICNIVLARLLSPDDFGCIGMLLVFISISDAIVDGGFGSALIQKESPTQTDYSTIFYWNIVLSVFLYILLFLAAPLISSYYKLPLLCDILRVQGIVLVINAFSLVQRSILKKQIAFRKNAKINLVAVGIATSIAIVSAYIGWGVWSLVVKSLLTAIILCVGYWFNSQWYPIRIFSWKAFASLFKFGGFIFLDTIINTIYINLVSLIIGKRFSASALGYYTQALKLEDIPRSIMSSAVNNVSFSALSSLQNDPARLLRASKMGFKSLMFIHAPLMMLMIVIAKPIFTLLFTEKWNHSVPFFQALCVMGLVFTAYEYNQNILLSAGKANLHFALRVVQCVIGIILINVGLYWGIWGFVAGFVISGYVIYIVVAFFVKRVMNYGLLQQVRDIALAFMVSLLAAVATFSISLLELGWHYVLVMLIQIITFGVIYILVCKLLRIGELDIFIDILKRKYSA